MTKQIKEKLLSLGLIFVMVVSIFAGVPANKADAAQAEFNTAVNADSIILYDSGCLKSIEITLQAIPQSTPFNPAYGRVAIHDGVSTHRYKNNQLVTSDNCTTWPDISYFEANAENFVAFAEGNEFLWTDCNAHTLTVTFEDGKVDLAATNTYYIYLWTRAQSFGIYIDADITTLRTENGRLLDASGNELAHVHNMVTVSGACKDGLKCDRPGCTYAPVAALDHNMVSVPGECQNGSKCDRPGCTYAPVAALNHNMVTVPGECKDGSKCDRPGCTYAPVAPLGHDMADATCTEPAKCKRTDCNHTEGEALGHDFTGEWKVVKEATTKAEGLKETLCVNGCGEKKTEVIPVLEAPKTGDTNSVLPMVALMAVAGAAMVVANKKREEEK